MAETSRFFASSTGDVRTYTAPNFAEFTNRLLTTGYFSGVANELAVTASSPADMNVNVGTGEAFIQEYYYKNSSSKVLAVTVADVTNPRIDRVIAELDLVTTRLITIKMLDGTAAAYPVAPTLTQTASTYQITLAQVYVAAGAVTITTGNITSEKDTITAAVSGANQAKANVLYSGTIYKLSGSDTGYATARTTWAMLCEDGTYAWLIGGSASNQKVEQFDMGATASAGTWTAKTNMTTGRHAGSAICYNGNIYVMGGLETATYSVKNEIYSISGNSWSAGTDLAGAKAYHCSALVGDDIYVFGGSTTGGGGSVKVYKYDVSGNSWTTLTDLPNTPADGNAASMCCVAVGTLIYIAFIEKTTGTYRFMSYDTVGGGYSALTAVVTQYPQYLFYYNGFIYGSAVPDGKKLIRYDITLGTWNNNYVADIGYTASFAGTVYTVFHKNRLFIAGAGGTASGWFTIHYPLATMTARAICGFRKNNDITYYALKNATTDLTSAINGTVGCAVSDILALYVNNKSATATAIVDVYG